MLNEFLLLTLAHVFAVASPGADFAVVLKNTLRSGKSAGLLTAVGVGCGISIHLVYTLLGMAIILSQSDILFNSIKMIGAVYLLWMAWGAFQSRKQTSTDSDQAINPEHKFAMTHTQAFRQGFITNVFNPKVTLFFLVLFSSIVSAETPIFIQSLYGLWLVLYTMLWFMLVAWFFSRAIILNWYQQLGHYVDWAMGVFLASIAVKLIFDFSY
jgi:RhtB (resistance to homoserine/threonine) family protein